MNKPKKHHTVPASSIGRFGIGPSTRLREKLVCVQINEMEPLINVKAENHGFINWYNAITVESGEKKIWFEKLLAELDGKATMSFNNLIKGNLNFDDKHIISQFLAMQILRGEQFAKDSNELQKKFFETNQQAIVKRARSIPEYKYFEVEKIKNIFLKGLAEKGNRIKNQTEQHHKIAFLLLHMRWELVGFEPNTILFGNEPVSMLDSEKTSTRQIFAAREIRYPLTPGLALLITWADGKDALVKRNMSDDFAKQINATTKYYSTEIYWRDSLIPPPYDISSHQWLSLDEPNYKRIEIVMKRFFEMEEIDLTNPKIDYISNLLQLI